MAPLYTPIATTQSNPYYLWIRACVIVAALFYRIPICDNLISFLLRATFIVSSCPQPIEPIAPLTLRLEGVKLGQRAMYSCPVGYTTEGIANATCLASGKILIILNT